MSVYTVAWLAWLAYFAIVEGRALFNSRTGDTLSEHVWQWFAIDRLDGERRPITGWVRLRRFALLAFVAWLAAHFLTGGLF